MLSNDEDPPRVEDCHTAVFTIDHELLEGRDNIGDLTLYITLKCDFILDCHGRPVDGNHLRGRLRTGDGTPGGIFESWFWVEDDEREQREERQPRERKGSEQRPGRSGRR